ncbi:MAG: DUF6044 family protein [Christensenellaceae bacterium]|jgi:hypothetical protein|nr:DUF6044 family protein [Christensenellaceae bacterium]
MKFKKPSKQTLIVTAVGFATVLFYLLPTICLGQNAYIKVWDNLDSEIIFNKLIAKYFFKFKGTVPQMMNIDVRAIQTFSIGQVILYMIFPTFWAYILNDFITRLIAYFAMYLAMNLILKNKYWGISVVTGILFATFPFFSVYGLTVVGIPLVFWAFVKIFNAGTAPQSLRSTLTNLVWPFVALLLFVLCSSLFLSGYFIIAVLIGFCIFFACKKRYRKSQWPFYVATGLMIFLYLLTNLKLILLMLSDYESHRILWNNVDIVKKGIPNLPDKDFKNFLQFAWYNFWFGHQHTASLHTILLITSITVFFIGLTARTRHGKNFNNYKYWCILGYILAFNVVIAFTSALFFIKPASIIFATLRLNEFNFSRFYHVTAFTWYASGGVAFAVIYDYIKSRKWSYAKITSRTCAICLITGVAIMSFYYANSVTPITHVWKENWFANLSAKQSPRNPTYAQLYDTKLFSEIEEYIGKPKNTYRVASIGMYPAVPLYNGFYTVDGYVQSYSYDYWKDFRKIIAGELDKSPNSLDPYFTWGNKCYLFTAKTGRSAGVAYQYNKKSNKTITSLEYDMQAFAHLGGEYIFSAVKIKHDQDGYFPCKVGGLQFMKSFTHAKSWWKIYVYKVVLA